MIKRKDLKTYLKQEIKNVDDINNQKTIEAHNLIEKEKQLIESLGINVNENRLLGVVNFYYIKFLERLYNFILALVAYDIFQLQDLTFQIELDEEISLENVLLLEKIEDFLIRYNLGTIQTTKVIHEKEYMSKGYLSENIEIRFRTSLENLIEAYDAEIDKAFEPNPIQKNKNHIRSKKN